jgi:uncharacterized protein (DUF849 family)
MQNDLIISLCPTGMVPTTETCPAVPISPKEIAQDVKRCFELGVSMVHIHARENNQLPSWRTEIFEEILGEIKHFAPELITTVTTSGRSWSDIERRSASLDTLHKPDMGSLTLGSLNFPQQASINPPDIIQGLLLKMNQRKIVPELEVFDVGMINYAQYLIEKGLLKPPYYFNLILGSLGAASLNAINLAAMISSLPDNATWSLGGIGRFQVAANTIAIALGGHIRIGLEDNPYLEWTNKTDASNPRLVERIVKIAAQLERQPASPSKARAIIGL